MYRDICTEITVPLLHEHGILHRDISPDNIMVLGDGSLKLLDFGGAKIQANTGLSNMVIAKKGYTPIEQYHTDGNQGVWTDVYAMAATIYFCITGQVPEESIQRVEKDNLIHAKETGSGSSERTCRKRPGQIPLHGRVQKRAS